MLHKFKMRRHLSGQLGVAKPKTATTDKWQHDSGDSGLLRTAS